MKKTIQVKITQPQYIVNTNVTFAQVRGWCGHITKDLKLDIIYPENIEKPIPCIVWICGGAWLEMSTCAHMVYLSDLARKGFVVASVQYRTSNEVKFPAQLQDVKAAIRYLKAHADYYNIDPERFGVMGESAGGHLCSLTALTGKIKEFDVGDYLEYSSDVQAACAWYVPSDFTTIPGLPGSMAAASAENFLVGKISAEFPEEALKASPVHYVTKQAPPMLLLHGTKDTLVPFSQGQELYDALERKGNDVTLIAIEGANHADLHFFQQEIWDMIGEFFAEKLS